MFKLLITTVFCFNIFAAEVVGESEINRSKLKYNIGFGAKVITPVADTGFLVSRYKNENELLEAFVGFLDTDDTEYKRKSFLAEIGYRYFLGNSFNMKGTFGYRKISWMGYRSIDSIANNERDERKYRESISSTVSIGNQWQWENFTLTWDYIGINYEAYLIEKENYPGREGRFETSGAVYIGYGF
jgi:hypothetical protein